jgi:hypothetical protein
MPVEIGTNASKINDFRTKVTAPWLQKRFSESSPIFFFRISYSINNIFTKKVEFPILDQNFEGEPIFNISLRPLL